MSNTEYIKHYGIKGMRWGIRKTYNSVSRGAIHDGRKAGITTKRNVKRQKQYQKVIDSEFNKKLAEVSTSANQQRASVKANKKNSLANISSRVKQEKFDNNSQRRSQGRIRTGINNIRISSRGRSDRRLIKKTAKQALRDISNQEENNLYAVYNEAVRKTITNRQAVALLEQQSYDNFERSLHSNNPNQAAVNNGKNIANAMKNRNVIG